MEEKDENVVEETTNETTEQVDESKFESAGDDSVIKVDLSKPPTPEPIITPMREALVSSIISPESFSASLAATTPNLENRSHLFDSFGSRMPVGSKSLTSAPNRHA